MVGEWFSQLENMNSAFNLGFSFPFFGGVGGESGKQSQLDRIALLKMLQ